MNEEIMETIELDLPDSDMLILFQMAHEKDMKFNDFINEVLRNQIEELEKKS